MTFLQPHMLWSLAALLPLTALYLLKVRPRRKPTTAVFLWEKALDQRRANRLFQRLRDLWSLMLMLIVCTAVCLALARPEWNDRRQDLLIVVDASASMSARQDGAARIDLAKKTAADIVEGLNGTQRAAVASLADKLVYRSHLTDNPRELLDAVESISAANQELRLDALPSRGEERNRFARDHRVLFISDGNFGPRRLPDRVELLKIGGRLDNLGITAADAAYLPGGPDRLAFYYQVASSFAAPREVDLILARIDGWGNEQIVRVIPLEIKPGTNRPETVVIDGAAPGKWIARLAIDDALPLDNAAYLAASKPDPIRIAVKSENRFFLENSVLAFSEGDGLLALVPDDGEVALADGADPGGARSLIFHPDGESCWWRDLGEPVEPGPARVMIENHPALRHLDASGIPFVGARRLTPPDGAQILAADDSGLPLIYQARQGDRTAVVVNMDPVMADFYFSAWFPVLVHAASMHLVGRENPLAAAYRPNDEVPVPGAAEDTLSTLETSPTNSVEVRGKWARLGDRLGFYELKNPSGRWFVSSSLMAEAETLLDGGDASGNAEALSRGRSPGQWLTMLAIVGLVLESVLYHRRKVG